MDKNQLDLNIKLLNKKRIKNNYYKYLYSVNGIKFEMRCTEKNFIKGIEIIYNGIKDDHPFTEAHTILGLKNMLEIIKKLFLVDFLYLVEKNVMERLYKPKTNNSITLGVIIKEYTGSGYNGITTFHYDFKNLIIKWLLDRIDDLNIENHLIKGLPIKHISGIFGWDFVAKEIEEKYLDLFPKYIESYFENCFKKHELGNKSSFDIDILGNVSSHIKPDAKIQKITNEYIQIYYYKYANKLINNTLKEMNMKKDLWVIYSQSNNLTISRNTLDFSQIISNELRREFKWSYRYGIRIAFQQKKSFRNIFSSFKSITKVLNYIHLDLGINSLSDIDTFIAEQIKQYMIYELHNENTNELLKTSTINKLLGVFRKTFDYLIERNAYPKNYNKPKVNVFLDVKLRNVDKMSKRTDVIPQIVLEQLEIYKDEFKSEYRRMFELFMGTGKRLKEIAMLEEDCLQYDSKGIMLFYTPYKVIYSQKKTLKSEKNFIYITEELEHIVKEQIEISKKLRNKFNLPYIFLSEYQGKVHVIGNDFSRHVNKIIEKNNICDLDGKLWHFCSRQTRKTVVATMISNGASQEEVMSVLDHLHSKTTNKYYVDLDKLKLADLNEKFFEQMFELRIDKKQLEKFNEEERRILFADFKTTFRDVEFGKCAKHPSEGICHRIGTLACANCSKICTGKKYLDKWKELLKSETEVLENLEKTYLSEKISKDEYCNFLEFKKTVQQIQYYQDVINRIQKG